MKQKNKAIAVLQSIETGDQTAFSAINPNHYTQHNLSLMDGIAGIASVVGSVPVGTLKAKVVRAFEDGDFVVAHTEYDFFGTKIGFDIFRFEDGLIVEHWDNLQTNRALNKSGRSMTDGFVEVKDLEKTADNKKLVEAFFRENILDTQNTFTAYMDPDFIQHNPDGADGLKGLKEMMEFFMGGGNTMRYDTIHKVLGKGNFVLLVSEGIYGEKGGLPTSFYDLFRVENNKIVEHWDVLERILPEKERKNTNGKFNF